MPFFRKITELRRLPVIYAPKLHLSSQQILDTFLPEFALMSHYIYLFLRYFIRQ